MKLTRYHIGIKESDALWTNIDNRGHGTLSEARRVRMSIWPRRADGPSIWKVTITATAVKVPEKRRKK